MLAYFGCDQSQVQRYLTARSVSEGRVSLLMSAFVKIPMQFLILMIGVMVFIFYQFQTPPMIFNANDVRKADSGVTAAEYQAANETYSRLGAERQARATELVRTGFKGPEGEAAMRRYLAADSGLTNARKQGIDIVKKATGSEKFSDVNYVFPVFVTTYMPPGVIGLIIAAIFAAAMSSISAELSALSTATVMDFYRRHFRPEESDKHYLLISKIATGFWGIFACVVAYYAGQLGSLIEVVNKFGSFFYGSLLGVFVLALGTKRATARGAFWGLLAGMAAVGVVSYTTSISFLWYNVVGCAVVVAVGMLLSLTESQKET
jgi:Na+/proline symporter